MMKKYRKKKIDSFINSLAGYCVVNYILGIGDRHNENMMINKKGKFFHIDFGFIFDNDPKPSLYKPITLEMYMVDCMGGIYSEKFKKFKQKCKNAYSILRENARTIVNMFYLMIDSGINGIKNKEDLIKLHNKFAQNMDKEQALAAFITEIEDTLNSYKIVARNTLHNIAKIINY